MLERTRPQINPVEIAPEQPEEIEASAANERLDRLQEQLMDLKQQRKQLMQENAEWWEKILLSYNRKEQPKHGPHSELFRLADKATVAGEKLKRDPTKTEPSSEAKFTKERDYLRQVDAEMRNQEYPEKLAKINKSITETERQIKIIKTGEMDAE